MKLTVEGMTCAGCIGAITRAIQALDPQAQVAVELGTGIVTIAGDVHPQYATMAIEAAGFVVVAVAGDCVAPLTAHAGG